jgi:hypothetical protein
LCSHSLARRLEPNNRHTEGDTNQRRQRAAERVPNDPDVRVGIHVRQIIVQVLHVRCPSAHTPFKKKGKVTHDADRVEQTIVNERALDTFLITLPPATVAITDGRPCPVDACTTATKQQVVVPLILLRRGPPTAKECGRRTLDRQHDGGVVRRRIYVPAEAVRIGLPAHGQRLCGITGCTIQQQQRQGRM